MTKAKTPQELFKEILISIHLSAKEREYIEKDAIMVARLTEKGFQISREWICDAEFKDAFKGNMVGYYLGLCVNCFATGLLMADAWADGGDALSCIKYDRIYDGGVWDNIFVLLEMKPAGDRKDFQNFIIEMYEKWVVALKDYFSLQNANEYIEKTIAAFFTLGVTMRLELLGY